MAPSNPLFSLYTVTPGASAYKPDPGTGPESQRARGPESQSQSQSPSQGQGQIRSHSQVAYVHLNCLYIASLQGWQVARHRRWVSGGFLWFLLQAEVAAP